MRHKSESRQHKDMACHRFPINCRSGSKKIQFLTSLNDKFSQDLKASFTIGLGVCQGTLMSTKRTLMSLGCGDNYIRCRVSGGGIERVFFSSGKQHDALKKNTMDKTLESTLKASIKTMLPTCDDKGVFTDDDDTYRKRK